MRRIVALIAFMAVQVTDLHAQSVVERNLPPAASRETAVAINPEALRSDDATPLGADVKSLVLIGANDGVAARADAGIQLRTTLIDEPAVRTRLSGFVGRPISRRLITDIQTAIAEVYRDAGRPFVSVTVPPQEITKGVLTLRVVEGRLGVVKVTGASRTAPEEIRARISMKPGDPVDAARLDSELDWLNRNPFRRTEAVFGPGKALAETELELRTTETKPWQVFAGYANSGTRLTGLDRYFTGATVAWPGDVVTSLQLTGSGNFWLRDGTPFGNAGLAQYVSPAGRISIPVGGRSAIELTGSYVQTNERPVDPFRIRTQTSEFSALYRSAVSNIGSFGFGDWLAGLEIKRQSRVTFFSEIEAARGSADAAFWVGGWTGRWTDALGTNALDLRLKWNSGGLLPGNTTAAWSSFSNGRVTSIDAPFVTVQFERRTPLPFGTIWLAEITGLIADRPLPDTERLAPGGAQGVRGYMIEDGVADQALIIRNALLLPSQSLAGLFGQRAGIDKLTPFLHTDFGTGRDLFARHQTTLASLGAGFDEEIGSSFHMNVVASYALMNGATTSAGAWRAHVRLTSSF